MTPFEAAYLVLMLTHCILIAYQIMRDHHKK